MFLYIWGSQVEDPALGFWGSKPYAIYINISIMM